VTAWTMPGRSGHDNVRMNSSGLTILKSVEDLRDRVRVERSEACW
jgi:hypothetical protein